MKQKRPFTTGEKLMTAVMALCLAAACVMGVLFFRVTRENSEAEKEQVLLEQAALATAAPTARLEPTKQEPQTTVPYRSPAARTAEPTETDAPQETAKESAEETEQESGGETEPLEEENVEEEDPTLLAILYAEQQAKLSATAAPTPTAEPPKVGTAVQQTMRYSVDFDSLRAINADVVGWLLHEGTEINFPIVQG